MLENMSIRKVINPKPRIGERSNPISGGTIPRKSRRYGSVILPKEENGWVKKLIFGNHPK